MRSPLGSAVVSLLIATGIAGRATGQSVANPPVRPEGTTDLGQVDGLGQAEDLASVMVDQLDAFLRQQTAGIDAERETFWRPADDSPAAWDALVRQRRERLRQILGIADRVEHVGMTADGRFGPHQSPTRAASANQDAAPNLGDAPNFGGLVAESPQVRVYAVRWPAIVDPAPRDGELPSVWGDGLLLLPRGQVLADIVAVPDADQSPEELCGLGGELPAESRFPLRLAAAGCRVIVPALVSREREPRGGRAVLTDREFVHRSAFVLGRTIQGYETQKVLAAADWLAGTGGGRPLGAIGYGEGGHLVAFAAAIEPRIATAGLAGCFASRDAMWREPLDRNLQGFVREFDSPHLGLLISPRGLVVEASSGPDVTIPGDGGAPGRIEPIATERTEAAFAELRRLLDRHASHLGGEPRVDLVAVEDSPDGNDSGDPATPRDGDSGHERRDRFGTRAWTDRFLQRLLEDPGRHTETPRPGGDEPASLTTLSDNEAGLARRRATRLAELDRHNQQLWRESSFVREQYFQDLDRSDLASYRRTIEPYRQRFRDDVIGHFGDPSVPPNPRARKAWSGEGWTGYEVVLDVFPEVIAYGALLLPDDLEPGERRPVVVFQHGLEGRPTGTFLGDHRAYHDHAARLCQRGYVVFAPQNPYLFGDRFRTLQRLAQPLGRTLFSLIVPQHQQIVNWLRSQSYVDPERIAFYGLSYGGKSAMRIPALVTDYCLSICSADFNEWVLKNASSRDRFSYVWTGEYEIFEWNLGGTFNYAEMAALICPRPFMVERGHFDGVGRDEWVAHEYAKVRHLYAAELGIPGRTRIEWFVGPHTIHGQGTTEFLDRHLKFGPRANDD